MCYGAVAICKEFRQVYTLALRDQVFFYDRGVVGAPGYALRSNHGRAMRRRNPGLFRDPVSFVDETRGGEWSGCDRSSEFLRLFAAVLT